MKIRLAAAALAVAITGFVSAPASAAVEVGVLRCHVEPTIGYVVASERWMECMFHPNDGSRPQHYRGRAGRIGLDFGVTNDAVTDAVSEAAEISVAFDVSNVTGG